MALDKRAFLRLMEQMLVIRRFEEKLLDLHARKQLPGHFHLYIGQEATGVAVLDHAGPDDVVLTTHRNHGHMLARGMKPEALLAEMMGRSGGACKGKGGTLHVADTSLGIPVTSGIVGGSIPIASGAALALRRAGGSNIVFCMFGDGVIEEGVFHEAINIAALWRLPVLFACENNSVEPELRTHEQYHSSSHAAPNFARLVAATGIPSSQIDGSDLGLVHEHIGGLVESIRGGDGPRFVEIRTSRWPGSYDMWPRLVGGTTELGWITGDAAIPEPLEEWFRTSDPLRLTYLQADGLIGSEDLAGLDGRANAVVEAAVVAALESPFPEPAEAWDDVFVGHGPTRETVRGDARG